MNVKKENNERKEKDTLAKQSHLQNVKYNN